MKAITLTQPWASLVALKEKQVETRSWKTSYRGPIAIHAAKGFPGWAKKLCETSPFIGCLRPLVHPSGLEFDEIKIADSLPTASVVAVAVLHGIYTTESFEQQGGFWRHGNEKAFGDYGPGRYAWKLHNIIALPQPVPAKGALSLWEWEVPADIQAWLDGQGGSE